MCRVWMFLKRLLSLIKGLFICNESFVYISNKWHIWSEFWMNQLYAESLMKAFRAISVPYILSRFMRLKNNNNDFSMMFTEYERRAYNFALKLHWSKNRIAKIACIRMSWSAAFTFVWSHISSFRRTSPFLNFLDLQSLDNRLSESVI